MFIEAFNAIINAIIQLFNLVLSIQFAPGLTFGGIIFIMLIVTFAINLLRMMITSVPTVNQVHIKPRKRGNKENV